MIIQGTNRTGDVRDRADVVVVGTGAGGATTPIETMYLSASSTLIDRWMTSARGNIRKKPDVGLGVVGTYTLTWRFWSRWSAASPPGRPVTKAIVHEPARGYCTRTASRKALPLLENSVSDTCLTEL